MGDQVVGGGVERLVGQRVEGVKDEQRGGGVVAQLGAAGLPPVPAPTGHAGLVAPDHLAWVGMLDHVGTVGDRVEGFIAGGAHQPRRTDVAGQVLAADRELVQHGHGVVQVGEPVDPRQSGACAAQQRLQAVAGALRLGAERPVRLSPRRHMRQVLQPLVADPVTCCGLRRLEKPFARLVARTRQEAVDGKEQRPVVRTQGEHTGVHLGAGQKLLKCSEVRHRRPPTVALRHPSRLLCHLLCPPPARTRPARTSPTRRRGWRTSGGDLRRTRPRRRPAG